MIHFKNNVIVICRLTAFVMKSFGQARPYITIDEDVIKSAATFVVNQQNDNGTFREPGRVLHKDLKVCTQLSKYFFKFLYFFHATRKINGYNMPKISWNGTREIAIFYEILSI